MENPNQQRANKNGDSSSEPLRVLFLAAEAAPFIKVGGLGDVAGSLPPAILNLPLDKMGGRPVDIRLVIPFYGEIQKCLKDPELVAEFTVQKSEGAEPAKAYRVKSGDLIVYLIAGEPFAPDEPVYNMNTQEDGEKFIFLSLASLELARTLNWQPDIVHANDWHTAVALYWLHLNRSDPFFRSTRSLISVHNLPFMGAGAGKALPDYRLPPSVSPLLPEWARSFPLPLGLLTADKIVAVSPTYAREILTPEFGCGLQDFLQTRQEDLLGILNGLDLDAWNPATDRSIAQHFDLKHLNLRAKNKAALQEELGLPVEPDIPLLIIIGRMDPQKGEDIAIDGLRQSSAIPWQVIFLGTGVPYLESAARSLEVEFPDRVRAIVRFDAKLSRRMYAGGDILLMPSRYEPCGLAQMIAMRYGCVPLARATGGLKDTIQDTEADHLGTGFLFEDTTPEAFSQALSRAILFYEQKESWTKIQKAGMKKDFSWQKSAEEYSRVYRQLMKG